MATANTGLADTHTAIFGNVRGDTGAAFQGQGVFFGRGAEDLQQMAQPGVIFQPAAVTSVTDVTKNAITDASPPKPSQAWSRGWAKPSTVSS